MESELHIPADIFEEMAGMKEDTTSKSSASQNNIKEPQKTYIIDKDYLSKTSAAMMSHVAEDISKGFYKVYKYIIELQNNSNVKHNAIAEAYIVKQQEEDEGKEKSSIIKTVWKLIKMLSKAFKLLVKGLKLIIKKIYALTKWVVKMAIKGIAKILKLIRGLLGKLLKFFKKTIVKITKIFLKITNFIFKMVSKILVSIWKIIKNLFFNRVKAKELSKFKSQGPEMKQPKISSNRNRMKLKLKAPRGRKFFGLKFLKIVGSVAGKVLGKLFGFIFKKFIKKFCKVLIRLIVKVVASIALQVVGVLSGGLLNVLFGAASVALIMYDIWDMVDTLQGMTSAINNVGAGLDEPQEKIDVEEEEIEKEVNKDLFENYNLSDTKAYLEKLEAKNKQNTQQYFDAKIHYLKLLSKSYENIGSTRVSAYINKIKEELEKSGSADTGSSDISKIVQLDVTEIEQYALLDVKETANVKWSEKEKNVFAESETDDLLTGEEDKSPLWISIWSEGILWYIKKNIAKKFPGYETIKNICQEAIGIVPTVKDISLTVAAEWVPETKKQRNNRVEEGESKIADSQNINYSDISASDFSEQEKFENVIDKTNKFKFSFIEVTAPLLIERETENSCQKEKYYRFRDILDVLMQRNATS